jgi:hypothetical protein
MVYKLPFAHPAYAVKYVSATQSRKVAEGNSIMTLHMMHMH